MHPNQEAFAVGDIVYLNLTNPEFENDSVAAFIKLYVGSPGPFTVLMVGLSKENEKTTIIIDDIPDIVDPEMVLDEEILASLGNPTPGTMTVWDSLLTHIPPQPVENPSVGPQ